MSHYPYPPACPYAYPDWQAIVTHGGEFDERKRYDAWLCLWGWIGWHAAHDTYVGAMDQFARMTWERMDRLQQKLDNMGVDVDKLQKKIKGPRP